MSELLNKAESDAWEQCMANDKQWTDAASTLISLHKATVPPPKTDTISPPSNQFNSDWRNDLISFLQEGGIDARPGDSGKGRGGKYIQIFGEKKDTDCRKKGMKRIGIYHNSDKLYLSVWGMNSGEITKNNLDEWINHIKEECGGWLGIHSSEWVSEWVKTGKQGGFTSRFLILNGMEKKEVCDIINKLIQ